MKKLDIDILKQEYVGKIYNWLTVIDILRENSIIKFVCRCKCGNVITTRKNYVLTNHTTSCGCYKCSPEKAAKFTQWCKNNPDKVADQALRYSQWCKYNPDKVKAKTEKRLKTLEENPEIQIKANETQRAYWKNNPDKLAERGKNRSKWSRDNPDKQKQINDNLSQYYKEHPEEAKAHGEYLSSLYSTEPYRELFSSISKEWHANNKDKVDECAKARSLWYKEHPEDADDLSCKVHKFYIENPDKAKSRGKKTAAWCRSHKAEVAKRNQHLSELYKQLRKSTDFSLLLDAVHPDSVENLLNGDISVTSKILTKCPICGKFDSHTLNNIFRIKSGTLKLGRLPLCKECRYSLTTSFYESDIANFISTFYNGTCVRNDRSFLNGKELDLYYPEKKVAIEFNGNYWHSDILKDKDYHYNKFVACKRNGIILVTIFESEWLCKQEAIKSYLRDLFSGITNNLSYKDSFVSNNYPDPNAVTDDSFIEDIITYKNCKCYTCGYSRTI